jgi:hypothetical protein
MRICELIWDANSIFLNTIDSDRNVILAIGLKVFTVFIKKKGHCVFIDHIIFLCVLFGLSEKGSFKSLTGAHQSKQLAGLKTAISNYFKDFLGTIPLKSIFTLKTKHNFDKIDRDIFFNTFHLTFDQMEIFAGIV